MSTQGRGLTPDEVARVLRRAAELDAAAGHPEATELVDAALVEEAAAEAGLSREAVRRAIDELALEPGAAHGSVLGNAHVVVERRLVGSADEVTAHLHRYLRSQLLQPRRVSPTRSRWVPRQGLGVVVRRATDLGGRLLLEDVGSLDLVVTPGGGSTVHVRLEADLAGVRRGRNVRLAGGAGAGALSAGTIVLLVGFAPAAVLAVPVGAGLAASGHLAARSYSQYRVGRVHEALAGELDRIEHPAALPPVGRQPTARSRARVGQTGPLTSQSRNTSAGTAGDHR